MVLLVFVLILSSVSSQMFDLSRGDTSLLDLECEEIEGDWKVENANKYGSDLSGKVLTSVKSEYSCLSTEDRVNIQNGTRFHIMVYLGYTQPLEESFLVDIVRRNKWYRWLEIKTSSPKWFEESYPLPEDFEAFGNSVLELTSRSILGTASIRYFALSTDLSLTTSPTALTESTTYSITDSTTESTTSSTNSTTDSITDSTIDSTTKSVIIDSTTKSTIIDSTTKSTITDFTSVTTDSITEYTTDSNTVSTKSTTDFITESTTDSAVDPSTSQIDPTAGVENSTSSPTSLNKGGFTLDTWSVLVGFFIGLMCVVILFIIASFIWWLLALACVKKRKEPKYDDQVALPRLRVLNGRQNNQGPTISGGFY